MSKPISDERAAFEAQVIAEFCAGQDAPFYEHDPLDGTIRAIVCGHHERADYTQYIIDAVDKLVGVAHKSEGAVPAGWKVVPVEPNAEMLHAGAESADEHLGLIITDCYRSMIAAAPVSVPVDASSEQATGTGWVPEILEGPGENVCYTQDNTPRAERKEMVVISAADHDRLRYFASIDEFSYAEETKLLSSISPTVLIGQLRKLRKDLRAAKKAIDPAPHSGEAAPVVADAQAEADLNAVYDVFAIGAKARTISTLLVNCQNASRRSGCLSAIEREFFTTEAPAEDPEEEGDTIEVCPLSWGSNRTEYVEQMRGALAERERIAVEAFKATASSQHVAVSDPVGHFIDDAADGEKPHYSQVAEVFKSAADVIPLYRAPLPRASDAPIGEAAVSDDSARIQDYAEQNMLTLEEAADELRAAPRHDRAPAIGEAGGVVAEEVLAAIKLACESRDIEFNADTPRATVGSLFLWERDNAAQPQAAPSGLSMDRMRELARETLDEGFSGGFYEETLTRLIGRAIAAAQAAGSGA